MKGRSKVFEGSIRKQNDLMYKFIYMDDVFHRNQLKTIILFKIIFIHNIFTKKLYIRFSICINNCDSS